MAARILQRRWVYLEEEVEVEEDEEDIIHEAHEGNVTLAICGAVIDEWVGDDDHVLINCKKCIELSDAHVDTPYCPDCGY